MIIDPLQYIDNTGGSHSTAAALLGLPGDKHRALKASATENCSGREKLTMHSKKGHSAGVWLKMAKDGSRAGQEHRLLEELLHHPTPCTVPGLAVTTCR